MAKDKNKFETIEEAQIAHDKLVEELNASKAEFEASKIEVANGAKGLADALAVVAELSEKLEVQEKHGGTDGIIVSVKKKSYKLTGSKFNIPGIGVVSAADLSKDKKALENLVEIGSSVLTEV